MSIQKRKVGLNRLEKLGQFLVEQKPKNFDFSTVCRTKESPNKVKQDLLHGCGSQACAVGYLPVVFSRHWEYRQIAQCDHRLILPVLKYKNFDFLVDTICSQVEQFFYISYKERNELFYKIRRNRGNGPATRGQMILSFVKKERARLQRVSRQVMLSNERLNQVVCGR